jgi:PAS domain S-box-containing protein
MTADPEAVVPHLSASRHTSGPQRQVRGWARYVCQSLATLAAIVLSYPFAAAQTKEVRRILILNEGGLQYPAIALINEAIREALHGSKHGIEIYSEYMETNLFPDEADQKLFRDFYVRKYQHHRPDVVITVGSSPLRFMKEERHKHFADIPVVFCEANGLEDDFKHEPGFTGVTMGIEAAATLEAALQMLPRTRHVFVVSGGISAFDRQEVRKVKEQLENYNSRLDITYLTGIAMPILRKRLNSLPEGSIVLLTSFGRDADGANFTSRDAGPLISSAANAPVFSLFDVFIGHGEVGGNLSELSAQGTIAAGAALKILDGASPNDIPVAEAPNEFVFDWRPLKRWGIKESNLPPGSIVLNRKPTVWESYKGYIVGGITLILVEALLIFALAWQRTRAKKAEAELVISYDRLRMAVEAGRFVGWDLDIKSGRNRWFGDLQYMFGIPSENYSAQSGEFSSRVHPDDRDRVSQLIDVARQSAQPYIAEFRFHRTDGGVRWVNARGKFYYAGDGAAQRMLGLAVDITDRKLAEQKLRESEERLAGIVGSAMDAIIAVDEERRIVLFNAAAEKMFGCTQDEAVGTVIDRFIPERFRSEHKAYMCRFGESGVTTRNMGTPDPLCAVRTNGQEFPMEASITHLESDGRKLFTVIVRDITERLRAEEAIRESEERFRLVANTAPVMIWTAGTDQKCSYVNNTWLDFTGRALEEELGDSWTGGLHSDDVRASLQTYTEAFDRRESFEMQYRLRRHDGEYRWVLDKGVPRFDPDGTFAGYIGSCIDITDRKLAEESLATIGRRLIEAHEEERTWIGRELHDDINQRLALLAVELDRWNQHPAEQISEQVRHAQERITQIAKDVQGLSHRLHSSKLEYLGLATAAHSFCRELSEQSKVEIQFSHSGIPRTLPKEVSLCLFRVLQEALQNAVKHSGVRSFAVNLDGEEGAIELTVSDAGAGFEEQEAFTRHGLGMISMRERLKLVKGELSVKSKPGAGTAIHAWVPLKADRYRAMAG